MAARLRPYDHGIKSTLTKPFLQIFKLKAKRIKELERENRELKKDSKIIKKAAGLEAQAEKGRPPK